jgi:hypothetical protein
MGSEILADLGFKLMMGFDREIGLKDFTEKRLALFKDN